MALRLRAMPGAGAGRRISIWSGMRAGSEEVTDA